MANDQAAFVFGEQLILTGVSILQDAFKNSGFEPNAFSKNDPNCTGEDKSSATDEDDRLLTWNNNREETEGLVITEKEPFDIQRFPTITTSISNGDMKNLDFGQFMRPYVKDGVHVGDVLGGGGEFDMVFRCMAESTAMRKKMTDRVMAVLLIKREEFWKYGVTLQTVRLGGYNSIPYINNDKSIYYSDIVAHCWGEWEFPFDKRLPLLKQFKLAFQLVRGQVQSSTKLLWNVENNP